MTEPILRVDDVVKHYPLTRGIVFKKTVGHVRAVDGVSFDVLPGETLGIVGESGCGKSTMARLVMKLEPPTSGHIYFEGDDLATLGTREMRTKRRHIQIVLQDPYTSLNPRMTVGDIVGEPFEIHGSVVTKGERKREVQRQRIGIARGLALKPKIIVCDEPVSALDVSVQAQVINLFEQLQDEFNLTYLFIAHDLSVVRHISDRVAVMYLGKVVEIGDEASIYQHPTHPYTQALLSAVPVPDPVGRDQRQRIRYGQRWHP